MRRVLLVPALCAASFAAACSGSDGAAPAADAAAPLDAWPDTPASGAQDGAPPDADGTSDDAGDDAGKFWVVAQCAEGDYVDARDPAAPRDLSPWDTSLGKRCLKIDAGQTVTWNAGQPLSAMHPLEAMGGDDPNPIQGVSQAAPSVTFPARGVFGFDCANHPGLMYGAIWVK